MSFFFPNSQANLLMGMDISLDPYYGQSSQLLFGHTEHTQQTAPQTPQTPSSIPDIVLQGTYFPIKTLQFNPLNLRILFSYFEIITFKLMSKK